ncbi:hypothetical protein CQ12_32265 [Bradyrhizobium jicamae]|uniref:Uncharacterized protein n=1 Tax=Bradyrhizobium jicamae TaxID=280332 RepID=A0A0R3MAA3_9BRAD|nr:hypothetical protein CQ12_32265 [Bradyrhizobium jicamae]
MKLHGYRVAAVTANMMAGGDASIFQPQTLKKASGAAEARVDFEEYIVAAGDVFRNEGDARKVCGAGGGTGCRLHENLAVMMTRKIQMTGADVYRLGWADFPARRLGSAAAQVRTRDRDGRIARGKGKCGIWVGREGYRRLLDIECHLACTDRKELFRL